MRLLPLASGSLGNTTLLELEGVRLLVDAGISARELAARLEAIGVAPSSIDGIVLSHEHQDHARGAERFSKKHGVPVICSPATLEAMDRSRLHFASWIPLPDEGGVGLEPLEIEAFPVPHDAARPVGFVFKGGGLRIGIATDLGHATTLVLRRLRGCHVLMIESNHDADLLRDGPYPWHLKERVGGRTGHLSNAAAAGVIRHTVNEESRAVVLAHLSARNNTPELARQSARRALSTAGRQDVAVHVASARSPSPAVLM